MAVNVEIPTTTLLLCIYIFNISVNVSALKPHQDISKYTDGNDVTILLQRR